MKPCRSTRGGSMKILKKAYVVTWRNSNNKIKDKFFPTEDSAREFYNKQLHFKNDAILARVTKVSLWENLLNAEVYWRGRVMKLYPIVLTTLIIATAVIFFIGEKQ
jgi:hypothetical protein